MGAAPVRPSGPSPNGVPKPPAPPAPPVRRLVACLLDLVLLVATVGVGWAVWSWHSWADATTPGKGLLGLGVIDLATRRPASRRRMAQRIVVHQGFAVLLGVVTLGVGWLYCVAPLAGPARRTVYDGWSRMVVVDRRG